MLKRSIKCKMMLAINVTYIRILYIRYVQVKKVILSYAQTVIYFDSDNLYVQELINLSLKYVSRLTGSTTLTFKLLLI